MSRTGPVKRMETAAARRADRTRPAASWENARMFPRIPGFVHSFVPVALAALAARLAGTGRACAPAFTAGAAAFTTLGPHGTSGTE